MTMRWIRLLCAYSLLAAPTVAVTRADLTNPPEGTISDGWYAVMLNGEKAGHMHAVLERKGKTIHSANAMTISIKRGPVVVSISMDMETIETVDGKPLRYEAEMNLAATMTTKTVVEFDGKDVKVTTSQFGMDEKAEYTLSRAPLLAWGSLLAQVKHGTAPGTKYEIATYEPAMRPNDVLVAHVEVMQNETINLFGRMTEATRTKTSIEGVPMEQTVWIDADGEILKMRMPIAGMEFEMVRSDRTFALQEGTPPEMFVQSLVAVERPLDNDKLNELRLRLSIADGQMPDLPDTEMQSVKRIDDRTVEITVRRIEHAKLKNASIGNLTGEPAQCLKPNVYMNFDDAEVAKMASAAVDGADTIYEKADALRRYVTREIKDKSLDIGLATASEIARQRQGDCTEHGVLLAALGRANGIPSRVVTGLVYVDAFMGQSNVFGFHMWTQFYLDGRWVDVDAAYRQTEVDPTHIALNVSSMNGQSFFDSTFTYLPLMGQLKIDVLEAKPD